MPAHQSPPAASAAWIGADSVGAGATPSRIGPRALGRLLGRQYLLGALVLAVAVVLPAPDESDEAYLLGIAAMATAIGIALGFVRTAPPVYAGITFLVILVSAVAAVSQPLGLTPLFYFWPLMLSAYYTSPRGLAFNTTLSIASFGIVLAFFAEVTDPAIAFLQFAAVTIVSMGAVRRLRQRVDRLFAELQASATRDALTGVLNRGAFEQAFDAWYGAGGGSRTTRGSLLLLDIDHFKLVNDTHGHPAGDAALRRLVAIVSEEIRETDALGRVGGEEFAVLLPTSEPGEALRVAERIRAAVETRSGEGSPAFTVSIGVADSTRVPQPWDAADRALYAAKRAGRNRVVAAGPPPRPSAVRDAA